MAHKDPSEPNLNWKFTEVEPYVYKIEQTGDYFDLEGFKVGCHEFY